MNRVLFYRIVKIIPLIYESVVEVRDYNTLELENKIHIGKIISYYS